ncbi:MAG TPA: nitrate reductase molybdenum cofactor assembly chaperone [Natronosporangium sp.]
MTPAHRALAARAASLLLRYPDQTVLAAVPTVTAALAELPAPVAEPLSTVAEYLATGEPTGLATAYVETFDFRRRCCLYLTYYTHGDTRARGQALAEFAAAYRRAGYVVDAELPDALPAVLELAAAAGEPGWQLLHAYRPSLALLHASLTKDQSVYRHVVAAVQALLPPAGRADRAAAARLAAAGPPAELVGLGPYPTGGVR